MVSLRQLAVVAIAGTAAAHPGEKHDAHHMKREVIARDAAAKVGARALGSCSGSAASQALKTRSIKRRADAVSKLRRARGITSGESLKELGLV